MNGTGIAASVCLCLKGDIMEIKLYALSTCPMCARVKKILKDSGMECTIIDVDLLSGEKKASAKNEMKKWDPKCPFPMLVINNTTCVIGDEPDRIKKVLGL